MANYSRGRAAYQEWTDAETETLRALFGRAPWDELLAALPRRTRGAIWERGHNVLRLERAVNKHPKWAVLEIAQLRQLYPCAEIAEVEAALPRHNWISIERKACALGIRRSRPETRANKRFVHPFMRELRAERERLRISRRVLAKKLGHGAGNILGWEMGKTRPDIFMVHDFAEALGFELVLKKKMTVEAMGDTVIPWPDKRRLMARR